MVSNLSDFFIMGLIGRADRDCHAKFGLPMVCPGEYYVHMSTQIVQGDHLCMSTLEMVLGDQLCVR